MVLDYMKQHGSINSWIAFQELKITRLSEYIRSLRHDDLLNISDIWLEKNGKRFKEYHIQTYKEDPNGQFILI